MLPCIPQHELQRTRIPSIAPIAVYIAGVISDPTSCVSRLTTEWRTSTQYMMPIVGFPSIVPVHRTRAAGKRASDA